MTDYKPRWERVLSLFPNTQGIGFAAFEGPSTLVGWGLKGVRKNRDTLAPLAARELISSYQPDILVLEDTRAKGSYKQERIRKLIPNIQRHATKMSIETQRFGRQEIKQCFSAFEANKKEDVAAAIATRLPELQLYLPNPRKPWMSEDRRMGIFDAVALAFTYYWAMFQKHAGREE